MNLLSWPQCSTMLNDQQMPPPPGTKDQHQLLFSNQLRRVRQGNTIATLPSTGRNDEVRTRPFILVRSTLNPQVWVYYGRQFGIWQFVWVCFLRVMYTYKYDPLWETWSRLLPGLPRWLNN